MTDDKHIVPTLLVGLGGIGSAIVDNIYGRLDPERRKYFGFLAFDTNVNDITKLKHLTLKDHIVQTSENYTVGNYISSKGGPDKFPWFDQKPVLARKIITDGAGQIRMVSRLGYQAALGDSSRFGKVKKTVNKIFPSQGSGLNASPRVVIISSLAGGTGAGIFLQVAMYLRKVIKRDDVLVTGIFLLPDALTETGTITNQQIDNIRANGYACIKELTGLTAIANGLKGYNFEMEIEPGKEAALKLDDIIYNYCFLFDFENKNLGNLLHFENYTRQMEDFAYLYLFSPLTKDAYSQADNNIRSHILKGGKNFYCASGVSAIRYPYHDLCRYYALRWTVTALRENWMKIDNQFRYELMEYKRKQHLGIQQTAPELRAFFQASLETFAKAQNPPPFFAQSYRSAFTLKKGELDKSKADGFLDHLIRHIESQVNEDTVLRQAQEYCKADETRLKNKKSVKSEIVNCEEHLRHYEKEVNKFIKNKINSIVNLALWSSCDVRNKGNADYELNTWILKKEEAANPVTVRYILYQLDQLLEQKINPLQASCIQRETAIKAYNEAYDDKDTDELESAEDRISHILKKSSNFLKNLLDKDFKDFTDTYLQKSSNQRKALALYSKEKLTLEVLLNVSDEVKKMIRKWETFFNNLEDALKVLESDTSRLENLHDDLVDPTTLLIFSDKAAKKWVWEHHFQYTMLTSNIDASLYEQIYKGQYDILCKERQTNAVSDVQAYSLLNEKVVKWVEENIIAGSDIVNINVVEALRKEGERKGMNPEDYIRETIGRMQNLATPLIKTEDLSSRETNVLISYGIHPDSLQSLGASLKAELFETHLIAHPEFTRHEIIGSNTLMGIEVKHLPKFQWSAASNSQGAYFREYLKVLKQSQNVSPHLDRRWDFPGNFPEINEAYDTARKKRIYLAFLLGLAYGYITSIDHIGDKTWQFAAPKQAPLQFMMNEKLALKWAPYLLASLRQHNDIADQIISLAETARINDISKFAAQSEKHQFVKGCRKIHYSPVSKEINIIELLLCYTESMPETEELLSEQYHLMAELTGYIREYFAAIIGNGRKANEEAEKFLDGLCNTSERFKVLTSEGAGNTILRSLHNLIHES